MKSDTKDDPRELEKIKKTADIMLILFIIIFYLHEISILPLPL